MSDTTTPYQELIAAFVSNRLPVQDFERRYLEMFKSETRTFPREEYEILNKLFTDIDMFCADPNIRISGELDENELVDSARRALSSLRAVEDP
jgi:Bacterial self-protective colicin-like immunity